MLIRRSPDIRSSDITDERVYFNRRDFVKTASAAAVGAVIGAVAPATTRQPLRAQTLLSNVTRGPFRTDEPANSYEDITTYNNFYEFGFDKDDPARYASRMKTTPWTIKVEGEMHAREAEYHLEDILKPHALEERVYRLRCVEAWSMVVPWIGFPLADLIKRFEPTSDARFVQFETLYRVNEMRGQRQSIPTSLAGAFRGSSGSLDGLLLEWPYLEGLRMDEALNPLTIVAVGLYGRTLPNQNGAPIRLVVPWKYGFKSIKSIVKIRFVKRKPRTAWNYAAPRDFGFYANVNPEVNRPINQGTERRIGKFFRQPTQLFNGYADQVGHMYADMDLKKNY